MQHVFKIWPLKPRTSILTPVGRGEDTKLDAGRRGARSQRRGTVVPAGPQFRFL